MPWQGSLSRRVFLAGGGCTSLLVVRGRFLRMLFNDQESVLPASAPHSSRPLCRSLPLNRQCEWRGRPPGRAPLAPLSAGGCPRCTRSGSPAGLRPAGGSVSAGLSAAPGLGLGLPPQQTPTRCSVTSPVQSCALCTASEAGSSRAGQQGSSAQQVPYCNFCFSQTVFFPRCTYCRTENLHETNIFGDFHALLFTCENVFTAKIG